MSSREDPSTLGGARGFRSGMVGRAGEVGGPRRPLIRNGTDFNRGIAGPSAGAMTQFLGTHKGKLDKKGRISVPARSALPSKPWNRGHRAFSVLPPSLHRGLAAAGFRRAVERPQQPRHLLRRFRQPRRRPLRDRPCRPPRWRGPHGAARGADRGSRPVRHHFLPRRQPELPDLEPRTRRRPYPRRPRQRPQFPPDAALPRRGSPHRRGTA